MSPAERATAAYRAAFGEAPARVAYAPGRVNLIGEHTDYNDGFVLPCAIDRGTAIAIGAGPSGAIEVVSADYGETDQFDPAAPFEPAPGWRTHVRAVAAVFRVRGIAIDGLRIAIAGDVPQGAGLSSSASLGVALAAAFDAAGTHSRTELALIAQAAENDFVGCACGNMDQLIAAHGEAGAALLIDCRSLATTPVPLPDDMALLIVHSGITRGLVDSAYNERGAFRHRGFARSRQRYAGGGREQPRPGRLSPRAPRRDRKCAHARHARRARSERLCRDRRPDDGVARLDA